MAYGCTVTVQVGQMPSSQSWFVWHLSTGNFPTASIDGGSTSILNGGGNLRCYTDSTKTTQLPLDVVTFVTGGTPSCIVWGRSPNLGVGDTVYIEADDIATVQPPVTDTYGRNAVWQDFELVTHDGVIDSTGNYTLTRAGGVGLTTGPFGNANGASSFDGSTSYVRASVSENTNGVHSIRGWQKKDTSNMESSTAAVGIYSSSTSTNFISALHANSAANGGAFPLRMVSWLRGTSNTWTLAAASSSQTVAGTWQRFAVSSTPSERKSRYNGDNGASNTTTSTSNVSLDRFTLGRLDDLSPSNYILGDLSEIFWDKSIPSDDYLDAEYNNQSSPTSFWSTGTWEDQSGGITVTVQDLNQSQTIDSVTLTQSHVLTLNELNQAQTIDDIVLGELSSISINELSQTQSLDNIALLGNQSITVNEVNQNQSIDNVDITQGYTLGIDELNQVQELGNVTITTGDQVAVNELSQNQTLKQITLVQAGVLVLDEINQNQLISNLNLQSMTPITVQNLSQSQLLENVDVTLLAELVQINDATQSQTIDEITLLQNSVIQVDSLSQNQLLQSINFGGVVVGYLDGELNIFYSLNGDILAYNAMNGSTKILG